MRSLCTIVPVLCLSICCWCSATTVEDISQSVDQILDSISQLAEADQFTQIKVPGFHRTGLSCKHGIISDLSTIERKGNCTLIVHGDDSAVINASLGLRTFKLTYPDCTVINFFRQGIQLYADGDQVSLKITMNHKGSRCFAVLDSITLQLFQNPRVYTTGYQWLTFFEDLILKWLIQHYEGQLLKSLYNMIWHEAEFLSQIDICKIRG